mmetsp:Transcript_6092/g.13303  ORF Transcript_6092/g.13303 Transcript_6092/m.13303 type:complete len:201 (-) Transcript_6092:287-889(-)
MDTGAFQLRQAALVRALEFTWPRDRHLCRGHLHLQQSIVGGSVLGGLCSLPDHLLQASASGEPERARLQVHWRGRLNLLLNLALPLLHLFPDAVGLTLPSLRGLGVPGAIHQSDVGRKGIEGTSWQVWYCEAGLLGHARQRVVRIRETRKVSDGHHQQSILALLARDIRIVLVPEAHTTEEVDPGRVSPKLPAEDLVRLL